MIIRDNDYFNNLKKYLRKKAIQMPIDKITFFVIFRGAINANPVIGLNNTRLI